jgi:small subunit ribosomal protein S6
MRQYELTIIIAPSVEDDGVEAVVEQVADWVKADGGQVGSVDHWGRRQLAYSIRDLTEGTYVLLTVEMKPVVLAELERNLKLNTDIVRYLLVRAED